MSDLKCGFEMKIVVLRVAEILPIRSVHDPERHAHRYKTILDAIREIGLVEPLIVSRVAGEYHLVDGHLRLHALKELGITETTCLVSTDDESYTYNARISRLSPIQEHKMIVKAVQDGLAPERIAATLNLPVEDIRARMKLLDGIHEEVIEILKDKQIAPGAISVLKKVTPVRQIEMAELMVSTNTFSRNYVEALLIGTPKSQLRTPQKPKVPKGMTAEEIARLEHEMEALHGEFKSVETSYGENMLNLTLVRGFVKKLFDNSRVARFLKTRHEDLFAEFEILAATELL
jgi:hypothetical protein